MHYKERDQRFKRYDNVLIPILLSTVQAQDTKTVKEYFTHERMDPTKDALVFQTHFCKDIIINYEENKHKKLGMLHQSIEQALNKKDHKEDCISRVIRLPLNHKYILKLKKQQEEFFKRALEIYNKLSLKFCKNEPAISSQCGFITNLSKPPNITDTSKEKAPEHKKEKRKKKCEYKEYRTETDLLREERQLYGLRI